MDTSNQGSQEDEVISLPVKAQSEGSEAGEQGVIVRTMSEAGTLPGRTVLAPDTLNCPSD